MRFSLSILAGMLACLPGDVMGREDLQPLAVKEEAAISAEKRLRPRMRPEDLGKKKIWCTADRWACISRGRFVPDTCHVIERVASRHALDPHFFARLVWKESLFDPGAVSHAGALGIAQFIPETAKRRGLKDPFNPAQALVASGAYLADLKAELGNLGLAAAAYNAGEGRVAGFIAKERELPPETRNYVYAITGHSGRVWRDAPPEKVTLALEAGLEFRAACEARVGSRLMREFVRPEPKSLWDVILAVVSKQDEVEVFYRLFERKMANLMGSKKLLVKSFQAPVVREERRFAAQIGGPSRIEIEGFCAKIRAEGGSCVVLRN